MTGNFLLLQI